MPQPSFSRKAPTSIALAAGTVASLMLGAPVTALAVAPTDAAVETCEGLPATIVGTNHRDRINGTDGPDVIVALGGNDVIRANGGDDVVCAGKGADQLYGGPGNDRLFGEKNRSGSDEEQYGDTFWGDSGDDHLDGGRDQGTDYLYYTLVESGIRLDRAAGTVTGEDSGADTFVRIGGLIGSPFDDTMIDDKNSVYIDSGAGNDIIDAGGGFNLVHAGDGDDTVRSAGGLSQVYGGEGNDAIAGEHDLYGDGGNDTLVATGRYGRLFGGDGDDRLTGGPYDDTLFGEAGDDTLDGAAGDDDGYGGTEFDTCVNLEIVVTCERAPSVASARRAP